NGQQWVWQDQGSPTGTTVGDRIIFSVPSVITFQDAGSTAIYAFIIGYDAHLYVNWWNGQQWVWQDQGTPPGQYISLKDLPRVAGRREDQAGRRNRETDPPDQRAQGEAVGASWVCTCCRSA